MLYVDYDRAMLLMQSLDLFVVRVVSSLQGAMLAKANVCIRPKDPFDVCVFYSWAVSNMSAFCSHPLEIDLPICEHVEVVDAPELNDREWQDDYFTTSGLAGSFLDLSQRNSVAGAAAFDLKFACAISRYAFDEKNVKFIRDSVGKRLERSAKDEDLEEWAKGFFKE